MNTNMNANISPARQGEVNHSAMTVAGHGLPQALGYSAQVVSLTEDSGAGVCLLRAPGQSQLLPAQLAESLLATPCAGDRVLCVDLEGDLIIVQILTRASNTEPLLMTSSRTIEWVAPVLRFKAIRELELLSAKKLTLSACDLVLGASRTLVQQARHILQQANDYAVTAKGLLRLNGRQQVITAEQDVRIDGERINMG